MQILGVTLCNSYYTKNTKKTQRKHKFNMDYTVENELSKIILGCAIEVHKQLGVKFNMVVGNLTCIIFFKFRILF
ncbi:MAG TPA: hypothetical protein DCM02_05485 [Flavobacterium sp.]|nr:hypothetical protein [Flavobacterium sp.]